MLLTAVLLAMWSVLAWLVYIVYIRLESYKKETTKLGLELTTERQKNQALIDEGTSLKRRIDFYAVTDLLTGLPSHQVFEDRFAQLLQQSKRFQLSFSIMVIDIDNFEMINDVLGRDSGSEVLKEVSARFLTCIRRIDTLSRLSDNRFVLLLPQLSKIEMCIDIASRLLEVSTQPYRIKNQDLFTTGTIGIATYPADGDDAGVLLRNAESALNQAKENGGNEYQFYHHEVHNLSRRELLLNSDLRNPNVYRDFKLYYQPIVHTDTRKIFAMEVMPQWHHPNFGLIQSGEFFRLAVKSGKMPEVSEWVLRRVLTQFNECRTQGMQQHIISIRIALKQLESSHFIHTISQLLNEWSLDPSQLMIEISEGAFKTKTEQLEKTFHMIKHLGVKVAVSHFGTGSMSLQYLKKLPVDYLKIDSALIQDITTNKESEAIVKMIISIMQDINVTVIAEGVETEEQKILLGQLGCTLVQGSLLGELIPEQELRVGLSSQLI